MTGQQLKNAILQLAIQGKLVPQCPDDEPASELLKRIRKEKEALVEAGKLKKKDLVTTPVSDEEKPFDVPESWEWCHLGDIFSHCNGKQLNNSNSQGDYYDYITTSNLYWDRFDLTTVKKMRFTKDELQRCTATKGDLLVCEGGDVGRSAIWHYDYNICIQNHIHKLRGYVPLCTRYFLYLLMLNKAIGQIGGKGIGIKGLSSTALHNIIVALPPLAEQHRIVAKIEELLPLVEEYDESKKELDALNQSLPEALKKSVLQQAIMGKLVPQDPKDEPASELLKRIREEKKKLVDCGKLKKKDLITTPVSDEEKPFDIPEGWEWVNINTCTYQVGNKQNQIQTNAIMHEGRFKVVSQGSELYDGFYNEESKVITDLPLVMFGDHTRNVKYIDFPFIIGADGTKFHKCICVNSKYIYYWMIFTSSRLRNRGYARHYSLLNKQPIPLPPLAEQHRIVEKLEEILSKIEELKEK